MKHLITLITIFFLLSFDYLHRHGESDTVMTSLKYELIKDIYVGVGFSASVNPHIFSGKFYTDVENFTVGVTIKF